MDNLQGHDFLDGVIMMGNSHASNLVKYYAPCPEGSAYVMHWAARGKTAFQVDEFLTSQVRAWGFVGCAGGWGGGC